MTRYLVLLPSLFLFAAGYVLERDERSVDQPPDLLGLVSLNPPGFVITWLPVQELAGEPVDGYKVHIWEMHSDINEHYVLVDGIPVRQMTPEGKDFTIYRGESFVLNVLGGSNSKVIFTPAKLDVVYEVRVQAFNKEGTGLLSDAMYIKLQREYL